MDSKSAIATFLANWEAERAAQRAAITPYEVAIARDIAKVNLALLPMLAVALGSAMYQGWNKPSFSAIMLWCIATLAVGATLGFLFGIPKSGSLPRRPDGNAEADKPGQPNPDQPDPRGANGRANTNLEEVSDWLTKIVVGLTLVHWETIRNDVTVISGHMAETFASAPTNADRSFAMALVVGFFTLGFLFGYLYTRMFLQGAFARSDPDKLQLFNRVVSAAMAISTPGPVPAAGAATDAEVAAAALPSVEQRKAAEQVRRAAPSDNPQAVLQPLRELAAEYERVRAAMPPSAARTREMSQIMRRMITLALAAAPYIDEFANSQSPGERLVAVAILQIRFDARYTDWLVRRVVEEKPFVGFQAAGALLSGNRMLGGSEKDKLQSLVRAAQQELLSKGQIDENRDNLLKQILGE